MADVLLPHQGDNKEMRHNKLAGRMVLSLRRFDAFEVGWGLRSYRKGANSS